MTPAPIQYAWAAEVIGKALDPDGHYGNQCVDTIDHYAQYIFGVPWQQCVGGVNGARNLLDVAPDKYWQRIDYYHGFIPQQFDVLVFDGDSLNQFGHTCVNWWSNPNGISMDVIQQDGFAYPWQWVDGAYYSAKPAHYYTLNYSQRGTGPLAGVLRPKPEMLVQSGTIVPQGTTTTDEMSEEDMNAVIKYLQAIFFGTYELGGRKDNPGLAYVLVENQKRITENGAKLDRAIALLLALPKDVWWKVTVDRDGKQIPALQELADIRSEQLAGTPAQLDVEQVFAQLAQRVTTVPEEDAK